MALHVYRYHLATLDTRALQNQIPPGAIALVGAVTQTVIDVQADSSQKADLDEVLAAEGWQFVATDPTTVTSEPFIVLPDGISGNPADAGAVRLPHTAALRTVLAARNNVDTGNYALADTQGSKTFWGIPFAEARLRGFVVALEANGVDVLTYDSTPAAAKNKWPIFGDGTQFSIHGDVAIDVLNADHVLTPAEYSFQHITLSSTPPMTADHTISLPAATAGKAYSKTVTMDPVSMNGKNLILTTGVGSTVTTPTAGLLFVRVDTSGVRAIGA